MKIVVLDGYVLNPGDLSWNGLKNLGDCTIPLTPNIATENLKSFINGNPQNVVN